MGESPLDKFQRPHCSTYGGRRGVYTVSVGKSQGKRPLGSPRRRWKNYTWCDNKVRELIAVKLLHTSLLNTTVVAFKVLPLGSYAPMPAPSPHFKTILELVLWNDLQS